MLKWIRKAARRWLGSTTSSPASWFVDWIRGEHGSDSGVAVDGKSALRYAPVWHAVNRICGRVAQLPCTLWEWQDPDHTRKRPALNHPAYRLLRREPNALMPPAVFKELLQYHSVMWGNGRAEIVRNNRAEPVALIPLLPDQTTTVLVNGDKWHIVNVLDPESGAYEKRKIRDENCLHIPGLGYDGIAGYPLWELAKNSWGLGLGQEKRANKFYRNNAVPGLLLEAPPGVFTDDEEARKFLAAFREMHEGLDNTSRTGLLRNGITAKPLSLTDRDSQTIEQRKFQRQDVALWFLLESILGDDSSVSYSSLEQKHLAELINGLNLWLVKWQEECDRKLLREREKLGDSHFFKFNTGALLRSDTKTTYEALTGAVRGMLLTVNEARAVIDYEPIDGGDVLMNPAITVAPAAEPAPEDAAVTDSLRQRLQAVITARVQDLAAVECKRLEAIADDTKRADFFGGWQPRLLEALTPLSSVSSETLAELVDQWIAASASQTPDESVWKQRASELASSLVTGASCPS